MCSRDTQARIIAHGVEHTSNTPCFNDKFQNSSNLQNHIIFPAIYHNFRRRHRRYPIHDTCACDDPHRDCRNPKAYRTLTDARRRRKTELACITYAKCRSATNHERRMIRNNNRDSSKQPTKRHDANKHATGESRRHNADSTEVTVRRRFCRQPLLTVSRKPFDAAVFREAEQDISNLQDRLSLLTIAWIECNTS